MSIQGKELPTKPGRDPERRAHQAQVKEALLEGQAWGLTYLVARVRDPEPYDNYRVPDDLAVFEFTVKGVLRLEMMDKPGYKGWRRMFGSNTKARELSTWRSRVSIKAFDSLADVQAYVDADLLQTWDGRQFTLPADLPTRERYVVFQVQDVWVEGGRMRWSEVLAKFLLDESEVLQLVAVHDGVPPVKRGQR
jgi:hypothetical protein